MEAGNAEALTVPLRSSRPQDSGPPTPATHGSSRHLRTVAETRVSEPMASGATSSLAGSPSQPPSHAT